MTSDLNPPKYAILKWEDWELIKRQRSFTGDSLDSMLLNDAEVIRGQDITAAPIFHAYSSIILSFMEFLNPGPGIGSERLNYLQQVSDHFHEAALKSEARDDRKLPD
jgi:hypothetical protein